MRDAMLAAMRPSLASMATIGIVFIPGMMTGQILGGATPMTAIKYQIAIMVSIFVLLNVAVLLTVRIALKPCFDEFGMLKADVFIMKENNRSKTGKRDPKKKRETKG